MKILIADDSRVMRQIVVRTLRQAGFGDHELIEAVDGKQALELGLRGYAKNLPDGRVEVLAAGSDATLDALAAWLRQGPPAARVDDLERLPATDDEVGQGFVTA